MNKETPKNSEKQGFNLNGAVHAGGGIPTEEQRERLIRDGKL
jgi:hypothetical protein